MIPKRYLQDEIIRDLSKKMVFLGGPRQVGKTTLAKDLVGRRFKSSYYNWDKLAQRRDALNANWPQDAELIILDEFHKHRRWKSWVKGEYDTYKNRLKFLLMGSAKLDLFRRGGDSLQGRYHHYRLHPFSVAEIAGYKNQIQPGREIVFPSSGKSWDTLLALLQFGGFPEPWLAQDQTTLRRWQNERLERLVREDIRDLTRIQDLGTLGLLADMLPSRAGSILSINSLSRDLQVNFRTLSNWITVFESLYYVFCISPYQNKAIKAVKKEKKLYLWDWSLVEDPGHRLENAVASHLLKLCHYLADHEGWRCELYFLRDVTGNEVDFLMTHQGKPWFAVEVKLGDQSISNHFLSHAARLKVPYCYQVVNVPGVDVVKSGVRVIHAAKFFSGLI